MALGHVNVKRFAVQVRITEVLSVHRTATKECNQHFHGADKTDENVSRAKSVAK